MCFDLRDNSNKIKGLYEDDTGERYGGPEGKKHNNI